MRQHKYRGLNTKGEMAYGSLVITTHGIPNMPKSHTKTWIVESAFGNGGWFNVNRKQYVIPETVGQFAGINNMDGIDLYEGDLVMCSGWVEPQAVFWDKTSFNCWIPQLQDYSLAFLSGYKGFETIGNIHQNPELLGE